MINRLIEKYSKFVTSRPFIVLTAVIVISAFAIIMAGTIQVKSTEQRDFLPKDVEVMNTLFKIEDEFGSTNMVFLVVEIDPQYSGSDEVSDVRDPVVIRYMDRMSQLAAHTDDVIDVSSPASMLKSLNNGRLPQSLREVQEITGKNGLFDRYFSKDYTMALVRIQTTDDVDLNNLEDELGKILKEIPAPPGINAQLGGTVLEGQVMSKSIGPDMARTTTYSLVGILMVILIVFRSVKYGFTPLTTIIFGSLWAMGYVGFIGMGLTSETSGVLSMIMGIGIDFGIQVVTRYRLELPGRSPQEAMTVSLNNVIVPMSTTTLAALIGFKAMSLGKLTFLADMGTIMAYGVVASMFAAITVVPAIIVILDSIDIKNSIKKLIDRFEVRT
ncbi:MAG: MMPL family transporter [Euryarchaeota archaeon]|nr:MMPL family transporter [Euryarchaeota archaeon]